MKVQLIVVRGKPEGKVIPLAGPNFKIGRGETCHLRPNSEQVSREHAEFTLGPNSISVRDLGSRNGTLVNGKALTEACTLKDRDLVQVGPLTFAVSILDAPAMAAPANKPSAAAVAPAATPPAPAAAKPKMASPDDISTDDIDSWLVGESGGATTDQPTAVYGGDTITIAAFKDASASSPSPPRPPSAAGDEGYVRQSAEGEAEEEEEEEESEDEEVEEQEEDDQETETEVEEAPVEELMDESNPFYVAKKAQQQAGKAGSGSSTHKQNFKDSSDAAGEILRKLREHRKASKS